MPTTIRTMPDGGGRRQRREVDREISDHLPGIGRPDFDDFFTARGRDPGLKKHGGPSTVDRPDHWRSMWVNRYTFAAGPASSPVDVGPLCFRGPLCLRGPLCFRAILFPGHFVSGPFCFPVPHLFPGPQCGTPRS